MIVYDITIYIIPTHTIDDIHTLVSSGIRNPLPLSDHTTVSLRSLQMTVLLIPFLPTGKIGPTKIPLTPVISEMLHIMYFFLTFLNPNSRQSTTSFTDVFGGIENPLNSPMGCVCVCVYLLKKQTGKKQRDP